MPYSLIIFLIKLLISWWDYCKIWGYVPYTGRVFNSHLKNMIAQSYASFINNVSYQTINFMVGQTPIGVKFG